MAGKNLLDQRGSRARHADDEDRKLGAGSERGLFLDQTPGEGFDNPIDPSAEIPGVERLDAFLQFVCAPIALERLVVLADVVETFSKSEFKQYPIGSRQRRFVQ